MLAEGNVIKTGLYLEFRNGVRIRDGNSPARNAARLQIGYGNAIELVAVVIGTRAVDEDSIIARIDLR